MCFFKKKNPDLIKEDRAILDKAEKGFGPILEIIDDDNVRSDVIKTKEMVHLILPNTNKKIISLDEKLFNSINDLSSEIQKEKLNSEKILEALKDIRVSIAVRNSKA